MAFFFPIPKVYAGKDLLSSIASISKIDKDSVDSSHFDLNEMKKLNSELKQYDLTLFRMLDIEHIGMSSTTILACRDCHEEAVILKSYLNSMRPDEGEKAFEDFLNELQILIHLDCLNDSLYLSPHSSSNDSSNGQKKKRATHKACPHILVLFGYGVLFKQPSLILEHLRGSIRDVLDSITDRSHIPILQKINPDTKLYQFLLWSRQMADSLAFIHSKRIVHCAIKPEHFMFHGLYIMDYIVLTNFTHAQHLTYSESTHEYSAENKKISLLKIGHSNNLDAPELFTNDYMTEKVDIWSLCLILLQLFSGEEFIQLENYSDSDRNSYNKTTAPNYPLCESMLNEFKGWVYFQVQKHNLDTSYIQQCSSIQFYVQNVIYEIVFDGLKVDPSQRPSAVDISKSIQLLLNVLSKFLHDLYSHDLQN